MKVIGFITEYNPFHYGHKYHYEISKKLTDSTHTIAVMSGSFVQRGEPSLIDKWTKAKIAIDNGIDLVIELPFIYSVQSAEFFAYGGVSILDSLNIVDYIAFGSEIESLNPLRKIASILNNEPPKYKEFLKEYLNKGNSFSSARSQALSEYIKLSNPNDTTPYDLILKQSNNILGIEYLKSLNRLNSKIKPISIKRKGNNYNDIEITTNIASATAIRKKILSGNLDGVKDHIPPATYYYLNNFYKKYGTFNSLSNYNQIFQYIFRSTDKSKFNRIMDIENGLENRIIKASSDEIQIEEIIKSVTTKRYPSTRIKRILVHLLSNLDKETIQMIYKTPVNYIRVLGSNQKGLEILRNIKNNSNVNIITKFADHKSLKSEEIDLMLSYEEMATNLYFLGITKNKPLVNMDYKLSPYITKDI
ncbi:nucleotidyltransferase [Tissierella sp. Yu-01]|uniref:nucleotidyltransferase n=1 Tax=Tissierella sp. Yu-01 TaxID=3035694 RepID=UPI00240D9C04|nr:nucleotidyltransferase [Tissierella sp. Yu-01]WFA09796.1 nucleotidyltransferase [Tissierella sp. Yu-01]